MTLCFSSSVVVHVHGFVQQNTRKAAHRVFRRHYAAAAAAASLSSSSGSSTVYTITCPPSDPDYLKKIVQKHVLTQDRFEASKPIAQHTAAAFQQLSRMLQTATTTETSTPTNLILDSGCGTGRSSLILGERNPNHLVIGVDRSIARLSRNRWVDGNKDDASNNDASNNDNNKNNNNNHDPNNSSSMVQQVQENVWLVRAELVDFWRCCLRNDWKIEQHYLLYPNPYPKRSRLKQRWYAHPSFPILLQLSTQRIVVRSNWELYLEEFRDALDYAAVAYDSTSAEGTNFARLYLPSAIQQQQQLLLQQSSSDEPTAWTNFEKKYFEAGEPTFEMVLRHSSSSSLEE